MAVSRSFSNPLAKEHMKSFIFTKHYNLPMVFGMLLTASGIRSLLDADLIAGLVLIAVGAAIYFGSNRNPPEPMPTPLPAPVLAKPDPLLLPIEWEAVFDEPVPPAPASFDTICQQSPRP